MAEFLSAAWIAALDRVTRESTALRAATGDVTATVEQVVPDAPSGAVQYHLTIDRGEVRVYAGAAASPDLTLVIDYEVALAINEGRVTAQHALAGGRLKIKGGMGPFVGHEAALAAIGDIFSAVRAATTYAEPSS